MADPVDPCKLLPPGKLKDACNKAQQDSQGVPQQGGGSFFGIPIPGSDWQRHFMFRVGEVIVGIAMIVVGVKAFVNTSPTTKIIIQSAKKANL
jgi:hypothetical protein